MGLKIFFSAASQGGRASAVDVLAFFSRTQFNMDGRWTIMVDNVISTLAPHGRAPDVAIPPKVSPINTEKDALFDSIAKEEIDGGESTEGSPLKAYFTAFLWFGYAVAISVALVLVWSATKELFRAIPH